MTNLQRDPAAKAAAIINANKIEGRVKKHRYEFQLPTDLTVQIGGIPFTFIGDGNQFITHTNPEVTDIPGIMDHCMQINPQQGWIFTMPPGFQFKIGGVPFVFIGDGSWVGTGTDPKYTNNQLLADLVAAQRDPAPAILPPLSSCGSSKPAVMGVDPASGPDQAVATKYRGGKIISIKAIPSK